MINSAILGAKLPRLLRLSVPYPASEVKSYAIVVCMNPVVTFPE